MGKSRASAKKTVKDNIAGWELEPRGGRKRNLRRVETLDAQEPTPTTTGYHYQLRSSFRHREPVFYKYQPCLNKRFRPSPCQLDKLADIAVNHNVLGYDSDPGYPRVPENPGHELVPVNPAKVVVNSVVKVFCTHRDPKGRQYNSSSDGFVIGERRVLTNAHSVEHHTVVKLKNRCIHTIYLANILSINAGYNLALLTLDDDKFWEAVSPVEVGGLAAVQDAITVVGVVGDSISLFSGVVSHITFHSHVQDSHELLRLEVMSMTILIIMWMMMHVVVSQNISMMILIMWRFRRSA